MSKSIVLASTDDLAALLPLVRAFHLEVARSYAKARKLYPGALFDARDDYMLMTSLLD